MSNTVLLRSSRPKSAASPGATAAVVLIVWFALVYLLGARGAFVTPPGTPPLPILIGFLAPILAFFTGWRTSRPFRAFVLGVDLRLATAIQAWRFAGLGFLALYVHGVLPGLFAWPAGLGDIAIGVTAPWIILALIRQPSFTAGKPFMIWNLLGILDLVVALGTGVLGSGFAVGIVGETTTGPMAHLPLVLIPAYFVPIFIMLHVTALIQGRHLAGDSSQRA